METSVLQLFFSICIIFPITMCQQLLLQQIKNVHGYGPPGHLHHRKAVALSSFWVLRCYTGTNKSCLHMRIIVYRYVNHQIQLRRNWGQTVPSQRIPGSQTKEKEFQVRLNILLLLNQLTIKSGFRKAYVWTIWSRQDSQRKSVKVHCFHYSADGLHQLKSCPLCIIPLDRGEKAIRLHALLIANETAIKTTSNQILKWSGLCLKSARRLTLL